MSKELEEINKSLSEIMQEIKQIKENDRQHDEILSDLKRATLIIEEYVTNRIPALFDAYSLNQDQHDEINKKFDNFEKVTDSHSLRISILEDYSKKHSKQLAKLTS